MVSVQEATSIILSNLFQPKTRKANLNECLGKILAEPILADRDFPPFDRATMDGIALAFDSYQEDQTNFRIESIQAAGELRKKLNSNSGCIEVMTGAMLPEGTDTIIPYEQVEIRNEHATINAKQVIKGQNIHLQGSDAKENQTLLEPGTQITPAEIALLASIGKTSVLVFSAPKFVIISTGNELVDIDQIPLPYQIRKSNSYALQAALAELGIDSALLHLADDQDQLKTEIKQALLDFDILLLSGGVSKGKFDFVPSVLESLGVHKLFQQVSQKPGKPMWVGSFGNKFVFALPGNPVSTFLCFHRYVKPWLLQSLGTKPNTSKAILSKDFSFKGDLTYFLQVKLANVDGRLIANPIVGGGSGDFVNLKEVDGFLELPRDKSEFKIGEAYPLVSFRA
ncbi:MAG: molybdopterin molybdotransferase MoeA [Cytophagales bacterium]|jgi:molybdopterin molybdotransferase|nr:molybdopterin molybdotransferase MoeA [Cytophagales bacterium]MCA6389026.1 molybdopterin molybdotransferase MoeA [Cytophagales bacterium]MCA6392851.1 molybdopterin molybdotransferase MoeA [Cytophagales bacterium]MCA6394444.1 molybdopterin molybdotransferase MoeA [Cytophagales bacterium]MCA6397205.1 molybdopterin molybdotransferase MoeA [Cytophagales bacterium]